MIYWKTDLMKNIIYTGAFRFPDKDAASQRVLGIAKALRMGQVNTLFCGWEQRPREQDLSADGIYYYDEFPYYSQAELDRYIKTNFKKLYHFLFKGANTIKWIKKYIKSAHVDAIIIYNANSYFIYNLYRLCKRYNIKLICDCTEWYDGSHLPGGKYGLANIDNNLRIRFLYPCIKNIISISTYLDDYFKKKGCHTIIVPPLVDIQDSMWAYSEITGLSKTIDRPINIIYAGDPAKKDQLDSIISALNEINKNTVQIIFTILGVSESVLKNKLCANYNVLPSYIKCAGRVDHLLVPQYYMKSDFSIVIREYKRYAHAGFPTKLVESLSLGIPVIANSTSDISKYIIDGKTGFLLKSNSVLDLIRCFEDVLALDKKIIYEMKINAYKSAQINFDIRAHSEKINKYIYSITFSE